MFEKISVLKLPIPFRLISLFCLTSVICLSIASPAGRTQGKPESLVSLAPSNTELIYSLGEGDRLAGVSSYCSYPEEAKKKPKVGSFISVSWERITKLKPNMVLLVSGQEPLVHDLTKHNIKSVVLNNKSLDDIANNLNTLGKICDCPEKASKMAALYRTDIEKLRALLAAENKPRVFYCVWPQSVVTVGGDSFLNDVITTCGGINVTAHMKSAYPKIGAEKIIASRPDLVVMPFEARNTGIERKPPWSLLKAVKDKRVYYLPDRDHDYLSRPTLKIFTGLFDLAKAIHPDRSADLKNWLDQCLKDFPLS